MRSVVVGTAGHVDHGKTALIEALTGYNGDELIQERERGITIDLSFTNLRGNGCNIALIDVPGHDRLVKTMAGGAFGFDAALLVVAADEGVMPQTREHLAVLETVRVGRVAIALSKSDLVDAERLKRRRREILETLTDYPGLELLWVEAVSIHDAASIERLKKRLFALEPRLEEASPFFRYYIDRVFSPRGIGTVVTGTVLGGSVGVGEKIAVAELGKPVAVKGIQIHGEEAAEARTHQRAALRLDLPHTRLQKGYLLCSRGYFRGFDSVDGSIRPLEGRRIPHNAEVLFVTGSKKVEGRVLYFPGEEFATIRLAEPVFTRFGDPYLLLHRGRVAAGGEILEPVRDPIRKRQKLAMLRALKARNFPEAFRILLANHRRGFGLISSQQRFALSHEEALAIARGIEGAFVDEKDLVLYPLSAGDELYERVRRIYEGNPRALLSVASIALRVKWASEALIASVLERLEGEGYLRRAEGLYLRADQPSRELIEGLEERVYRILDEEGLTPEAPYNLYDRLDLDRKRGERIFKNLTRRKKVIRLARNLFVTEENLRRAMALMREIIVAQGYIDIRNFKAMTGMSRKYCIAYLEYLDRSDEVIREGEKRVLRYR